MANRNVKIAILASSLTFGMMAYAPAQIKEGRQEQPSRTGADNTITSQKRIKKASNQPLPIEIENLINDARVAPAEFGADALIRIAQSSKVTSPARKRALLEEAFRRAAAQNPVRREALAGSEVDTRSGYLSYAFDLKLDTLSLRCGFVA